MELKYLNQYSRSYIIIKVIGLGLIGLRTIIIQLIKA